jgi:hypothetical protein
MASKVPSEAWRVRSRESLFSSGVCAAGPAVVVSDPLASVVPLPSSVSLADGAVVAEPLVVPDEEDGAAWPALPSRADEVFDASVLEFVALELDEEPVVVDDEEDAPSEVWAGGEGTAGTWALRCGAQPASPETAARTATITIDPNSVARFMGSRGLHPSNWSAFARALIAPRRAER